MYRHHTLEANVVRHCNNRCVACSHGAPVSPFYEMSPDVLRRDLTALRQVFHCTEFWVLGGEPLLHGRLMEIFRVIHESGICDRVGILTNAKLIDRCSDEFWHNIHILRISQYPNLPQRMIDVCRQKCAQYNIPFQHQIPTKFYTCLGHPDPQSNFNNCIWKANCWTLHEGYLYLCPEAVFWPELFMNMPDLRDGLSVLEGLTEQKIHEHATKTAPYVACRICDSYTQQMDWHESTGRTKEEWIAESTRR